MMNFEQKLYDSNVEIYALKALLPELGDEGVNYDIANAEFTINWSVELETRSWGIKDVYVLINSIAGSFTIQKYDEHGNEAEALEIDFDPQQFAIDTSGITFSEYRSLQINTLDIDCATKIVKLMS